MGTNNSKKCKDPSYYRGLVYKYIPTKSEGISPKSNHISKETKQKQKMKPSSLTKLLNSQIVSTAILDSLVKAEVRKQFNCNFLSSSQHQPIMKNEAFQVDYANYILSMNFKHNIAERLKFESSLDFSVLTENEKPKKRKCNSIFSRSSKRNKTFNPKTLNTRTKSVFIHLKRESQLTLGSFKTRNRLDKPRKEEEFNLKEVQAEDEFDKEELQRPKNMFTPKVIKRKMKKVKRKKKKTPLVIDFGRLKKEEAKNFYKQLEIERENKKIKFKSCITNEKESCLNDSALTYTEICLMRKRNELLNLSTTSLAKERSYFSRK